MLNSNTWTKKKKKKKKKKRRKKNTIFKRINSKCRIFFKHLRRRAANRRVSFSFFFSFMHLFSSLSSFFSLGFPFGSSLCAGWNSRLNEAETSSGWSKCTAFYASRVFLSWYGHDDITRWRARAKEDEIVKNSDPLRLTCRSFRKEVHASDQRKKEKKLQQAEIAGIGYGCLNWELTLMWIVVLESKFLQHVFNCTNCQLYNLFEEKVVKPFYCHFSLFWKFERDVDLFSCVHMREKLYLDSEVFVLTLFDTNLLEFTKYQFIRIY